MKKKILMLAFVFMFGLSNVVLAVGDANVLAKLQKNSELMIGAFDDSKEIPLATLVKMFTAESAKVYTEEKYAEAKKLVAEKFGKIKETKFYVFQRLDQIDVVVYVVAFTKEKAVNMAFIFDKSGKLDEYQFTPLQTVDNPQK